MLCTGPAYFNSRLPGNFDIFRSPVPLHCLPGQVGIFDADVYGPSLPTMISPSIRVLEMNPETKVGAAAGCFLENQGGCCTCWVGWNQRPRWVLPGWLDASGMVSPATATTLPLPQLCATYLLQ